MKLRILKHHIEGIINDYGAEPWESENALRLAIEGSTHTFAYRTIDGLPGIPSYPDLFKTFYQFAQARLTAVKAVQSGNFTEIPDFDPFTKQQNFDIICDACSNFLQHPKRCRITRLLKGEQP